MSNRVERIKKKGKKAAAVVFTSLLLSTSACGTLYNIRNEPTGFTKKVEASDLQGVLDHYKGKDGYQMAGATPQSVYLKDVDDNIARYEMAKEEGVGCILNVDPLSEEEVVPSFSDRYYVIQKKKDKLVIISRKPVYDEDQDICKDADGIKFEVPYKKEWGELKRIRTGGYSSVDTLVLSFKKATVNIMVRGDKVYWEVYER